ncbi:MAG: c-type cytochrome domain-containing protein [Chloroflexota bacterium]
MKTKLLIVTLIMGLLAACAAQPNEVPASPSTEEPAPATQASTNPPTDTAIPPAESPLPTQEPTATAEAAASATVSFANDILPILKSRCVNCHGGERVEEGLLLRSYSELMAGSDNGPVIIPGDAENSLLVELVVSQKMPKRGPKLTPPQVQLIVDWVNQGAPDN